MGCVVGPSVYAGGDPVTCTSLRAIGWVNEAPQHKAAPELLLRGGEFGLIIECGSAQRAPMSSPALMSWSGVTIAPYFSLSAASPAAHSS